MPDKNGKKKNKQSGANQDNASPGAAISSKVPEGNMNKENYPRHNPQNAR